MNEEVDFFEGQRPLTRVVCQFYNGKAQLTLTPWEEWRLIEPTPFVLKCGNHRARKLTQRIGISHTQHSAFESSIGALLGQKGIAAVESSLKSVVGQDVTLAVGSEVEETFSFDSPRCGYKIVKLYQRVRVLHMAYNDERFWHRCAVEKTLEHWLSSIYDGTVAEWYDPDCHCPDVEAAAPRPGRAARISGGLFAKLAVLWGDSQQLEFPDTPASLNDFFDWGDSVSGRMPASRLPDYLRFLTGIAADAVLPAKVWQESTWFGRGGGLADAADDVLVEFDDDFRLLEPAYATAAAAASAAPAAPAADEGAPSDES